MTERPHRDRSTTVKDESLAISRHVYSDDGVLFTVWRTIENATHGTLFSGDELQWLAEQTQKEEA